jgi:hypothetical protein
MTPTATERDQAKTFHKYRRLIIHHVHANVALEPRMSPGWMLSADGLSTRGEFEFVGHPDQFN